jgi:MFS family permease
MASTVRIIYLARGLRGFGDGFATIVLPVYLTKIGYDLIQIGFVLTGALLGTALFTLAIGVIAPRCDLRTLMIFGAALMMLTGPAFPAFQDIALILLVAFIGTINPSTGDIGVLVPLEHSMLARSISDQDRTNAFSNYSLVGALSMAVGTLAAALPDLLINNAWVDGFKLMFYSYAALGLGCAVLYARLPHARMTETSRQAPLGPSRPIVYKLAALFSLDAFAGGFAVQSLMALWLFERFHLSVSMASLFFFWAGILSALSYPVATRLAHRFGLINTMVFTHIPSSLCLILAAYSPNLYAACGFLLLRSALSQMDVPTRTSYVMAVVTPAERTTAASITAVPRSLASAVSPALGGALLTTACSGLPLIVCGSLKIVYDLALLYSFRHIKPSEENVQSAAGG